MKKILFVVFCFLCCVSTILAEQKIQIKPNHEDHLYKIGETADFEIKLFDGEELAKQGVINFNLTLDSGKVLNSQTVDFSKTNPIKISYKLDKPGFLRLQGQIVSGITLKVENPATATVGFDPEKIKMGNKMPKDFLKFWQDGIEQVKLKSVELIKIEDSKFTNELATSYRIVVETLNNEKVYGFLAVPNKQENCPIYVEIPGAGSGIVTPSAHIAQKGTIALSMNVHKFMGSMDAAKLEEEYNAYNEKIGVIYAYHNADNRETYHYRNTILAIDKAIKYCMNLPQWDKKTIVIDGSSQGGGLSLMLSGLNSNITACAANVPALCDHAAEVYKRQAGWPQLHRFAKGSRDISPYYDTANFAKLIKIPTMVGVCFIDDVCSPSSVYSAYNEIKSEKNIIISVDLGHTVPAKYYNAKYYWIKEKLNNRF